MSCSQIECEANRRRGKQHTCVRQMSMKITMNTELRHAGLPEENSNYTTIIYMSLYFNI